MHCPHCSRDIDDPVPECPECGFHIRDLDAVFGEPPERDGPIVDAVGILSRRGLRNIDERIDEINKRSKVEIVVATVASSHGRKSAEYVFWLFNRWAVGGEQHRGVAILVDMEARRIESEVGASLEAVLTDDASEAILSEHAAPLLAMKHYDEGLLHAVDVIGRVLENASK